MFKVLLRAVSWMDLAEVFTCEEDVTLEARRIIIYFVHSCKTQASRFPAR